MTINSDGRNHSAFIQKNIESRLAAKAKIKASSSKDKSKAHERSILRRQVQYLHESVRKKLGVD